MNRPTHCYLGLTKDNKLEIVVSDRELNPLGHRLTGSDKFPNAVYDFYQNQPVTPKLVEGALRSAQAYLRGEEAGTGNQLTIGDTSVLNTKRRKKS